MKKLLSAILLCLLAVGTTVAADAQDTYVQGHYRSNGTYVQGYHRSSANSTKMDNYSTKGNYNPYTGQAGTVNPYSQSNYGSSYGNSNSNSYGNSNSNYGFRY